MHADPVRPPPAHLPPVDSAKWHSRRNWDGLGYIRVRTLANPNWHRDPDWLIHLLDANRAADMGPRRDIIDTALKAARDYRAFVKRNDMSDPSVIEQADRRWDGVLTPLDEYLEVVQRDHLRAVRQAGASGPGVPEL